MCLPGWKEESQGDALLECARPSNKKQICPSKDECGALGSNGVV